MAHPTSSLSGSPAVADVGAAHARLLADKSIQFQLTEFTPPLPPAWLRPLIAFLQAIGPYLIYVFWAAVISGALIILFLIVREVTGLSWRWQKKAEEIDLDSPSLADEAVARILLAEAEALAESGDYDAAVHLLLRRSVEDIVERMPEFLQPSFTARDIAVSALLPVRARGAFATIALVVEAALFARLPVGAEGWRRARDAYADFALRDGWTRQGAAL